MLNMVFFLFSVLMSVMREKNEKSTSINVKRCVSGGNLFELMKLSDKNRIKPKLNIFILLSEYIELSDYLYFSNRCHAIIQKTTSYETSTKFSTIFLFYLPDDVSL